MFSRIALRTAIKSANLVGKNAKLTQVALQSTATNVDPVIKSSYTPSPHVPTDTEYNAIPVEVNGEKIVVDINHVNRPWPDVPTFTEDNSERSDVINSENPSGKSLEDDLCVWFGHDMPTIYDDKSAERDLVNFPRIPRPDHVPATRMLFVPESFFKFFEQKTGVTGPYVFAGTFGTMLISKEYFVIGDDVYNAAIFGSIIAVGMNKLGQKVKNFATAFEKKEEQGWIDWQNGMVKFLEEYINKNKEIQTLSVDQSILFNAKRENVQLQREAEYRRRLMEVYNETQRKLNYHIAVEEAERQFSQKHLVDWVINNVNKGLTQDLEKSVLQQCVADLKVLSQKRKNAI